MATVRPFQVPLKTSEKDPMPIFWPASTSNLSNRQLSKRCQAVEKVLGYGPAWQSRRLSTFTHSPQSVNATLNELLVKSILLMSRLISIMVSRRALKISTLQGPLKSFNGLKHLFPGNLQEANHISIAARLQCGSHELSQVLQIGSLILLVLQRLKLAEGREDR